MRKTIATGIVFICFACASLAQGSTDSATSWQQKPAIHLFGFMDVFYVYDFNEPQGTKRQAFLFNHNRHNEFNVNLGVVKLGVAHAKYRANFALHAGTYVNDNYAAEPGVLKNIFEANVGISLNKKNNLWLDAGIFSSHLGFESALSIDNMTLTRSLSAESSPYYMSGAKLTFHPNSKWEIAGLMVNGWQRMQRVEGNSLPSFGTQVNFSPTDKITLNWSTFIGTDDPDTTRRMRYFNNVYAQFQVTERIRVVAGFDVGTQQRIKGNTVYDVWFSPVLIGQFVIDKQWKTAIRAEYYQDETGIIIQTGTLNGFKTTGFSWNVDYTPTSNLACRLEGRWLNSVDNIFETNTAPTNNNFFIGTSIAIRFGEQIKK